MKKGHRRTQSANLASAINDQPIHVHNYQSPDRRHNIMSLLQKCQTKTQQKICQIQSLHAVPKGDDQKMFNFGKGLLKVNLEKKNVERKDNLISIPQKQKPNSRQRKTFDAEPSLKHKPKANIKSILKISNKETRKGEVQLAEGVNKLIKMKLGEPKCRKLSMYEPGRSIVKQWKHKKEVSNLK